MSQILVSLITVLIGSALLIAFVPIHELGHLALARLLHERVTEIVWFNRQFYKTKHWALGWIRIDRNTQTKRGTLIQSVYYETSWLVAWVLLLILVIQPIIGGLLA
jgi:hypothetical protein